VSVTHVSGLTLGGYYALPAVSQNQVPDPKTSFRADLMRLVWWEMARQGNQVPQWLRDFPFEGQ
jgi:hypothetical protein